MNDFVAGSGGSSIATVLPTGLPVPMMVCHRPSGAIVSTNLAARELFQLFLGDSVPADWSLWASFDDLALCRQVIERLETGDQINHLEVALRRRDGTQVWAQISAHSIWHDREPAVVVTFADITELKSREAAQAQMLERLGADATALANIAQDLDDRRHRAEEANRAKSTFLTEMSHELRSPLNAILGFAEIIRDRHFGDEVVDRYAEYAGMIHAAGSHLLALINDILDLSKIESGKVTLDLESLNAAALLRDCTDLLLPLMSRRSQTISLALDETLTLWADRRRVRQMILNLLSNAAKFAPAGGQIRLSVQRLDDDCLAIIVSDNGSGMTSEEISIALQPFGQIGRRGEAQDGDSGTGLGLPIVKSLIELHGGRFVIDSVPERGTTIALVFPAPAVAAP